jgi:hypothetical protein
MSKILAESGLKAVLSKHKIKDNGLQKALASYEKLDDNAHDDCLTGIAQVSKLATALKKVKEVASNKDVASYLEDLISAAQSEEKDVEKARSAAAKQDAATQKNAQKKEEEEEEENGDEENEAEDEEEEEGDYGERLLTAFKKLKTMNGKALAFIVCDARPLPSIMVAKRISPKHKDELSEISGGSRKFLKKGLCYFANDHYVLDMEQSVPGLARKVQKSVKNHTGKKLKFSHGGETAGDEDEESEGTPEQNEQEATPRGEQAAAATASQAPGQGAQTPKAENEQNPGAPGNAEQEKLEDRRREFKKARAAWVAVKTQAEEDLEKVKDGAHETYMHDMEQFPKIVAGCKGIDDIMDNLDDELRDTLDQYASTSLKNQAKLQQLATSATEILDRYTKFVEGNEVMKAIDLKEFADVTIHAPVLKALRDLRRALS